MCADYFLSLNVASSKKLADKARSVFHSRGISTWMCTDIHGGNTYREDIVANVRDAKVFLIFLNEKWAKSDECVFEYNYAMRKYLTKKTPIIMPVVTENFDMEEYAHVDALLANFQGVFMSSCSSETEAINQIMEKLKGVVPVKAAKAVASSAAPTPKPKSAKLSAAESKELSVVLSSKSSQALPSGHWIGYFIDHRAFEGKSAGSKWLIDVNMTFQNRNQFTGTGIDEVGPFTFKNGKITGSKLQFTKEYGTHQVCYEGKVLGVQMTGRWWLDSHSSVRGEWAMWPVG
ncbi:uncharacterized protein LOC144641739 [Oculina patagonica]